MSRSLIVKGGLVTAALAVAVFLTAAGVRNGAAARVKPSDGWNLHITAKMHFPGKPEMIAHHYCKPTSGGLTECLLFDSDRPDARVVGVETIVGAPTYAKFTDAEKAMWHYHKTEIPLVDAKLPDLSAEEAAKVVASIATTYGKIYLLYDPAVQTLPTGKPSVTVLPTK